MFRKDPDGLSVMPPLEYKIRFQNKLDQIFDLDGISGGIGGKIEQPAISPATRELILEEDEHEKHSDIHALEIGEAL